MAKVDHSTSFYQKMAELQEKLKRSEEERMKLEEKFTLMMKSCREEEEMRIRALRERYEKFVEDDKRRRDRNEIILQTLEKIESRASALSAKSERLKLLRRHYEAYLVRMYPLWKKQSSSTSQPSVPTNYLLSLPMDTEKNLQWFGGGSGLYMNNTPLPSAQSSLSPGSDQLWVPAVLSRNIRTYDNTKQTTVPKPMERKYSVVETSSPDVEGALDNYLQRAAELLRVPVEELEGHSEKRDEEKSVHTEQDTSRDLLNVSLSDDSILFEKKAEKTRGNATIVNAKETMEKMVKEDKHVPDVDHLAGGDNMLSELQAARYHQQDILNQPEFAKGSAGAQEENVCNSIKIGPEIAVNKNISDTQCIPSEQELLVHGTYQNSELQDGYEERLAASNLHNSHVTTDENLEYNSVNNANTREPFANASQQEYVDNAPRYDASYESVQHLASEIQQSSDVQLHLSNLADESPENMELLHYALEQEAVNEEQECIENVSQNDNDLPQQLTNIIPQEYTGNQDGIAQITVADEHRQPTTTEITVADEQGQPNVAIDESQLDKDHHYGEYAESQYSGNDKNYGPQNTDVDQNVQEQYVENPGLQYEQYPNNSQQYEQEQYIVDEEQLYDQHYPEQYSNEQYVENSAELEEPYVDNEGYTEDQYGASKDQYEGQLIDPNQQDGNVNNNDEGENINEESAYIQNEGQNDNSDSERGLQEHVSSPQPALNKSTEEDDLENTYQADKELIGNETLQKDNVDNQEYASQEHILEQRNDILDDQVLENQEDVLKDVTQQEMEQVEEERTGGVSKVQEQQSFDVNATEQVLMKPDNPSAIEDDSEESSTGFWNPPYQSSIPSVDELAPKAAAVMEDTSESSADSKMGPTPGKPSVPNTVQQFRTLLGVPSDTAGDSALSDQEEVEDQLAALVEDPAARTPAVVESKPDTKTKEVKPPGKSQKAKEGKPLKVESSKSKSQKDSKMSKSSASAKPLTRTGLKKPPSLIKVLESDTESLNLDTGASNEDSDEFDFSTE